MLRAAEDKTTIGKEGQEVIKLLVTRDDIRESAHRKRDLSETLVQTMNTVYIALAFESKSETEDRTGDTDVVRLQDR